MRHVKWFLVVSIVGLLVPAAASAQVCGDADGDGHIDIGDMAIMMRFLAGVPFYEPSQQADCDNRLDITVSDVEVIGQYIFYGAWPSVMDCSIETTYGFAPSLTDTVFLPYMNGISDGINSVSLPVLTSFAADTKAFYLPMMTDETNGPDFFAAVRAEEQPGTPYFIDGNVIAVVGAGVVVGVEIGMPANNLVGRHNFYNLVFERAQPGVASIVCTPMLGPASDRLAVKKGDDLYMPVVQYYEVPVPTANVSVTPSPLAMTSWAGFWSTETYQVTFTSDQMPVSFNLAVSDNWIVIQDPSPTGYTTPATITVQANASALATGVHNGQITFSDIDPADATIVPDVLDVVLTVTDPVIYPPGDLNCDGLVTIGDIVLLIEHLFIDPSPIEPCQ